MEGSVYGLCEEENSLRGGKDRNRIIVRRRNKEIHSDCEFLKEGRMWGLHNQKKKKKKKKCRSKRRKTEDEKKEKKR